MDNVTIDNYYPTSNYMYFISCILKVHVPTCFPCHIWDPNIAHLFANSTSTTCALFCQKSRSDKSAGSAGRRTAKLRDSARLLQNRSALARPAKLPSLVQLYSCTAVQLSTAVLKRKCIHLSHTITLFQITIFLRRVHGKDPSVSKPLLSLYV